MVKHEIKVEIEDVDLIKAIIQKSYFDNDGDGKIKGNANFMEIGKGDVNYKLFSELDGATIKVSNQNIIDGTMRFMIKIDNTVKLYPISTYSFFENGRYNFY